MLNLCSYNIENFTDLFENDNSLKTAPQAVERCQAIADVLKHIDSDLIGIVEAPRSRSSSGQSTTIKLENFARVHGLRTDKAMTGYLSAGSQEIALLYDSTKVRASHAPGGNARSKSNPKFDGDFYFDTDDDRIKEVYSHYRPPLEAKITVKESGRSFRLLVVHTKSKGIFNSVDLLHLERESRRNSLKIFAECSWIRRRVDEFLKKDWDVVVMGDVNDGPGMDFYEMRYGKSGVEVIMGSNYEPDRILRNFAGKPKWTRNGWRPSTVRFKDRITGTYINVLIDHILTSPGLKASGPDSYIIWNPHETRTASEIREALVMASDHYPVSLTLNI